MTLDYSVPGQVSIDMSNYIKKMVKEFSQEILKGASVALPWNENLFKVQHESVPLEKNKQRYSTLGLHKDYSFASMVVQRLHQQ